MYDMVVCLLLVLGVASGLFTMQRHHGYFAQFRIADLCNGRLDGWLYILNQLSTATCAGDIVLRIGWLIDVGWNINTGGDKWHGSWLTLHVCIAVNAILTHVLTNILLERSTICRLCQQPFRGRGSAEQ